MKDWDFSWSLRCKTRRNARFKKALKKQNHRRNRQVAKRLDTIYIRLNGWDVM